MGDSPPPGSILARGPRGRKIGPAGWVGACVIAMASPWRHGRPDLLFEKCARVTCLGGNPHSLNASAQFKVFSSCGPILAQNGHAVAVGKIGLRAGIPGASGPLALAPAPPAVGEEELVRQHALLQRPLLQRPLLPQPPLQRAHLQRALMQRVLPYARGKCVGYVRRAGGVSTVPSNTGQQQIATGSQRNGACYKGAGRYRARARRTCPPAVPGSAGSDRGIKYSTLVTKVLVQRRGSAPRTNAEHSRPGWRC